MKLAGALAVPLVALVVVTALEVVQSSEDASQVRDQSALAEISVGPASVLSRLEDERNAAAVYLLNAQEAFALPIEDNAAARVATDDALATFESAVESRGGDINAAYRPALDAMDGLAELRDGIDSFSGERGLANIDATAETFDAYSELMTPLFDANRQVALAIDNAELRRGAELVDLSSRQTNLIAILTRDLLLAAISGNGKVDTPDEIQAVAQRLAQLRNNEQLITTKATGDYQPLAEALLSAEEIVKFPEVVDEALTTGTVDVVGVTTYSAGEDPETYGYTVFRQSVTDTLTGRADDLESAASARQRWYVILAVVALAVAVVVTWLVSRSITKPLRSLTRQATTMADHRLPEAVLDILDTPLGEDVEVPEVDPVAVHTRDEVADVADALNTVQDTALDLAVEQAVLRRNIADSFVNLGRRNQNLLGRQLDFITELETHETNPDTLANLFRLDHLATRMRRNAESLLVLAGIEPSRKWASPVRLTDVIRAALGEVEDYQRVSVRGVEPATIVGSAAADLAHLLAELIENALVFSPPDQTVDIRGRNRPDGYALAIIDSGMGMAATDIESANRRLAGAESFTIAPSKYLGHYVAGNLAARHDIGVHLDSSPGNGVTGTINIPPALLTTDAVISAPVTPPHGGRAVARPGGPAPAPTLAGAGPPRAAALAAPGGPPAHLRQPATTASWPAPASLTGGAAAAQPAVARTESGLAKRAPRGAADAPRSTTGAGPSEDLLAALSRYTAPLAGEGPVAPAPPTAPPARPPGGRSGSGLYDPRGRHEPRPGDRNGRHAAHGPLPVPPPAPSSPQLPPAPSAPPLTRRVRGAQLPNTAPLSLRRTTGEHRIPPAPGPTARSGEHRMPPPPPPPPPAGPAPPVPQVAPQAPRRTPEQKRTADDVYSFLTSFTAGVQRGLDDARPPDPPDERR
jgi:signal transduction histidine kinase